MGHKYTNIMFTESVKAIQIDKRSRDQYSQMEQGIDFNFLLSANEANFIQQRDSFYMASVSETGWPYVQHRGGPVGFMKIIDEKTLGFADYSGNRQYISAGNVLKNDRVSLFFMDYANRRRLKLAGRVEAIGSDQPQRLQQLKDPQYRAKVERGFIIHIEAFDWNCPQHITPRYSELEVKAYVKEQLAALHKNGSNVCSDEHKTYGEGTLPLIISGIRQLTPEIRAYELRHVNDESLPPITPGAHLTVPVLQRLDSDVNKTHEVRHYSICSNPSRRDIYEIAVLKQTQSNGGSKFIHQYFQLGDRLNCSPPANFFHVETLPLQPIILLAGGIGITPIKSLAQYFIEHGHPVTLHYAGKSLKKMAFAHRLQRILEERIMLYPSDGHQRLSVKTILEQAPSNALFFACGPERLLKDLDDCRKALNISQDRVRTERFQTVKSVMNQSVSLSVEGHEKTIEVPADQSILDALIEQGYNPNYSCKTGQCKQCVVKVLEGQPDHRDQVLTEDEKTQWFCPCVSRAKTKHLHIKL